jgi:hypothetical protein
VLSFETIRVVVRDDSSSCRSRRFELPFETIRSCILGSNTELPLFDTQAIRVVVGGVT